MSDVNKPLLVCIDVTPTFKPGDPAPEGYNAWHEWAKVQHRAGLRQSICTICCKWRFPQEQCCVDSDGKQARRMTERQHNAEVREVERFVKKHYPSAEERYRKEVREAMKRGEI